MPKKENELDQISKLFDCIPENIKKERVAPKIDLNAIPAHIQSVMVFWNRKEIGLEE